MLKLFVESIYQKNSHACAYNIHTHKKRNTYVGRKLCEFILTASLGAERRWHSLKSNKSYIDVCVGYWQHYTSTNRYRRNAIKTNTNQTYHDQLKRTELHSTLKTEHEQLAASPNSHLINTIDSVFVQVVLLTFTVIWRYVCCFSVTFSRWCHYVFFFLPRPLTQFYFILFNLLISSNHLLSKYQLTVSDSSCPILTLTWNLDRSPEHRTIY